MKKKFYFATLVIALLTFTGCANDEYVGDQQNLGEQNGAIAFSTKSENTVRGETSHLDAPEKLNSQFWVYGTKKVGDVDKPVFNNYRVEYDENSTSLSSPKGWEYVGKGGNDKPQTIKYWDYSASQYDFEAYSYKTGTNTTVEKLTEDRDYSLKKDDYKVKVDGAPEHLYFAQKEKKTKPENGGQYSVVELKFKSVLSKIRVGFYETIPGYSVKIDRFYGPNGDGNNWATSGVTDKFVAWCPNNKIDGNMSFVVAYDDNGTPAITKVKVTNDVYKAISSASDNDGYKLNSTLTLGNYLFSVENIGKLYSEVTWDNVDRGTSKYTYVIPQNQQELCNPSGGVGQVQPMKIKVDYTLTSDDDSQEEIHVKGATAIVPKEYVQWEPNTAYSYVFKISDQTNGNTGDPSTDPAGLYPITFDAFVEDMAEYKDHLTTVSDLSITATQGTQFAEADKAAFKTGQEIKVKVMYNDDITSNFYENAPVDKFEAAFVIAANYNSNTSLDSYLTGDDLKKYYEGGYIPLGSQANAGYWIVRVTYKDGDKTIIKYAVLKVG